MTDSRYILISLPSSIVPSNQRDDALSAVNDLLLQELGADITATSFSNDDQSAATTAPVIPFSIPTFKIGTLDALVQQAEELEKLNSLCEAVTAKVGDVLATILEGKDVDVGAMKLIDERPVEQYLKSFSWNRIKYRVDKPLWEIMDLLQKEASSIDADVRGKFGQYTQTKSYLATLQRKQTGNLATKSLISVVDPSLLVQDSEYLESHLVAVPNRSVKDFLANYETIAPMVVPRSSTLIASDDEFTLYAVTTFKRTSAEFIQKCRENRWTPRDYKYVEGGKEEERRNLDQVTLDERRLWGEVLRLGKTGWSEIAMVWVHVYVCRVFVETVLRYGLPLDYVCGLIKTTPKYISKVRSVLEAKYSYLAGNAFARDKKGRVKKDELDGAEASVEFTPFVYYQFGL